MKRIITTVGTSMLTNALGTNVSSNIDFKRTRGLRFKDGENRASQIEKLKNILTKHIKQNTDTSISAEIDSIIKIANEYKEDCDVYLIATDTIQSPICAEYIQKWFEQNKIEFISTIHFRNTSEFIIEDLQVKQKRAFERNGLTNLFSRINTIAGGYWDNVVFNITGGYKALIPYMSLIAQINNLPAYYNFQESNDDNFDLLKIPNIPISVDFGLFEKYWKEIEKIATTGEIDDDFQLKQDLASILEIEGDLIMLSSLGLVLWEKYKSRFFLFKCSDIVWEEIEVQQDIKRILADKFSDYNHRKSKTERKQVHYVFDDGNNNNRIYYLEKGKLVYVYKTFENEGKAKAFIETSINEEQILNNSKLRKIEITK